MQNTGRLTTVLELSIHNIFLLSPHRPEGFETFLQIYGPGVEKGGGNDQ
jgi:hypothetical protein